MKVRIFAITSEDLKALLRYWTCRILGHKWQLRRLSWQVQTFEVDAFWDCLRCRECIVREYGPFLNIGKAPGRYEWDER